MKTMNGITPVVTTDHFVKVLCVLTMPFVLSVPATRRTAPMLSPSAAS
jgi:hypothetical protein